MKRLIVLFLLPLTFYGFAQIDKIELDAFSNVMIHPYIEVELRKGNKEKIEFISSNVDLEEVNVEVNGRTLHVYLEDAKVAFKRIISDNYNTYRNGTRVKAIITYRQIDKLSVYGEERLTFSDDIDQRKLQLKIYGESDVRFQKIDTGHLKVGLYGDNKLSIKGGDVSNQVFSSYGENKIYARNLHGSYLRFVNFGDSELYVGEQQYVRITAFGDATLSFIGDPVLDKRIALGDMTYVSR